MQKTVTEKEAEHFLEKEGFKIVKRAVIKTSEEIAATQKKLSFPWAMKVSSSKIAHKGKIGGVILNIDNAMKAQEAFDNLSKIEGFEGVIIQEMMSGEEVIIGIKKTPEFGHAIMFGRGGSAVEKEKDVSFKVLPAPKKELKNMIAETKFYKTLEEKGVGTRAVEQMLLKVEKLVKKYPNIIELDINPLAVTKEKAEIIDARMILEE